MTSETNRSRLSTVISGSYRRHLSQLMKLRSLLEERGIQVLSPVGRHGVNPGDVFVVLDADPVSDHRMLQDSIFGKMRTSSFHVLANVDGYLGSAAVMEVGYAIALGLLVYTLEPIEDPNLAPYTRPLAEVFPEVVTLLAGEREPERARVS